jgi:hypothetical protein
MNADPLRTPTLALFAKPDYYLSTGAASCSPSCVTQNSGFAWDHGDYAAEIDTNYVGFVGPEVAEGGERRETSEHACADDDRPRFHAREPRPGRDRPRVGLVTNRRQPGGRLALRVRAPVPGRPAGRPSVAPNLAC